MSKIELFWFFISEEEKIQEKKNGHRQGEYPKIQITKIPAQNGKIIDEAKIEAKIKAKKIRI